MSWQRVFELWKELTGQDLLEDIRNDGSKLKQEVRRK